MELNLLKLEEKSKEIHHLINNIGANDQIFENHYDSISSKVSIFSIILILFVVIIGFLQFFYLRKKIFDRKMI
jgi:hypothetical protein